MTAEQTAEESAPLVSVLMPVRNEADSVEGAVRSVLLQTWSRVEVLVIDGRSEDGTRDILEAMAATDPRVRVLDNPDRAISPALNVGLAAARGDIVARVDAHASVNPEYLETGARHLLADPSLAAVGGRRVGVASTSEGRAIALALSSPFGVGNSVNHYGTEVQRTDHASFGVYRADLAREVGGWDSDLLVNEDVDFDFRLLATGHEILYDPSMVISWHVRENIRDLARQYRRYGRGKGNMVRKNGRTAVRVRHLTAPALVGALGLSAVAAVTGHRRTAAVLSVPYVIAVGAATAITWRTAQESGSDEETSLATLPGAFVAMHLPWGVGFFEGLAGVAPYASSKRDPDVTTAGTDPA